MTYKNSNTLKSAVHNTMFEEELEQLLRMWQVTVLSSTLDPLSLWLHMFW